ncbi:ribonuclease H-like domain-containing protein [Rhizophagus irregularis DAOM 181602=DAOM 197198]|nr:ribonuclease H-like domain-containing protein [Rhizophagus irregularis DAOM 181602=DAOM 197198]
MLRRLKIEMIRWMNDMFRLGGTVCKDCEEEDIDEIDNRVKRLQKIFGDIGTITTEEELLRLTSMGYDVEITEIERTRKFGVTAKIITTYEIMRKYLTIWNLEDEVEEDIKGPEIGSSKNQKAKRNARVNMTGEYDDQEKCDYNENGYEEPQYDGVYYTQGYYDDYEDGELNYHSELYAKDNAVKTRRQTRRTNPTVGYKNNNEEGNLQEELRGAGSRMDDREIPSGTTTPNYIPERTEQNWDKPIGPRKMKWSNKRQDYYDPTGGLRKWREAGGPTKPREYGPRLTDEIRPYDIEGDVKNCRANITYGQLINESTTWCERCEIRWVMELQQYNFEVIHRSGKENTNADALSRLLKIVEDQPEIVIIDGVDGLGKTSIVQNLIKEWEKQGLKVRFNTYKRRRKDKDEFHESKMDTEWKFRKEVVEQINRRMLEYDEDTDIIILDKSPYCEYYYQKTKSFDRGLITPHGNHEMEKEIFRLKETIDKSIVIFLEKDGDVCWKNYIGRETKKTEKSSYPTLKKDEYLDMVKMFEENQSVYKDTKRYSRVKVKNDNSSWRKVFKEVEKWRRAQN